MTLKDDYDQHKLNLREVLAQEFDAFDSIIKEGMAKFTAVCLLALDSAE